MKNKKYVYEREYHFHYSYSEELLFIKNKFGKITFFMNPKDTDALRKFLNVVNKARKIL